MLYFSGLYLLRNKVSTGIFIIIMGVVVFGEMTGLLVKNIAKQAEMDAYTYNGAAMFLQDDRLNLTREDYEKIREIPHVLGVGNWKEVVVTPLDSNNVKEHTGEEPKTDVRGVADKMVILAHMDTEMYRLFRWEKTVSLVEGEFPCYDNKGILVEKRYADSNRLVIGDELFYQVDETEQQISMKICGIYEVDAEFQILEPNDEGTSVYIHSPYNTIFMDYDHAVELMHLNYDAAIGGEIYVDSLSNIQYVADELHKMFGSDIAIYDNTTTYLTESCRIVGLMQRTSWLICIFVLMAGEIIVLLVFSLYANQHQRETGLLLILGKSRRWCLGRYALITASYITGGFVMAFIAYQIFAGGICRLIGDVSLNVIRNSQIVTFKNYITPGLGQGFQIEVHKSMLYSVENMLILFGMIIFSWLVSLALPLYSVFKSRPRTLLSAKN